LEQFHISLNVTRHNLEALYTFNESKY
jgi:hypothetical protein